MDYSNWHRSVEHRGNYGKMHIGLFHWLNRGEQGGTGEGGDRCPHQKSVKLSRTWLQTNLYTIHLHKNHIHIHGIERHEVKVVTKISLSGWWLNFR